MPISLTCKTFLQDLLAEFGPVDIRGMFSGAGVYADGVMFALLVNDRLYLKTDPHFARDFEAEGKRPFTYRPKEGSPSPCPIGRCRSACWTIRRSSRPGRTALMPSPRRPRQSRGGAANAPGCC